MSITNVMSTLIKILVSACFVTTISSSFLFGLNGMEKAVRGPHFFGYMLILVSSLLSSVFLVFMLEFMEERYKEKDEEEF